jgi:hypothetical protein
MTISNCDSAAEHVAFRLSSSMALALRKAKASVAAVLFKHGFLNMSVDNPWGKVSSNQERPSADKVVESCPPSTKDGRRQAFRLRTLKQL